MPRSRANLFQFSVIMLDLDDFKSVNDKFGHGAGDFVLKETGRILKNNSSILSPNDLFKVADMAHYNAKRCGGDTLAAD
jgi:GGDEF domain-containing protein